MTDFDRTTWKSRVADWWRETARDLPGTMRRLGVRTSYGLLTAGAFLPLLEAYASEPGPAVTALVGIASGVGSELVANLVQGAYDKTTVPRQVERQVAERPELRAEVEQVLAGLDVLTAAQTALGDQWVAFEARLQEELARMGGRVDSGGGAIFLGDVRVSGDFIAGDKYEVHYHPEAEARDTTDLQAAYLREVVQRAEQLVLLGVDTGAADPGRVRRPRLAAVYVDLETTTPRGAPSDTRRRLGKDERPPEMIAERGAEGAFSTLEATATWRRLVITGEPGSGKSTFVRHLALCLALAQLEPGGGWLEHLPGWPDAEGELLPVVVVLRDFVRWAAAQDGAGDGAGAVGRFLEKWLADRDLAEMAQPLREALRQGRALVFFDGLDEIPTRAERTLVRDAVAEFARVYEQARVVVTCRTRSYQDAAWQLDPKRFAVVELAPFDEERIDRFVGAWYEELGDLGAVRPEEVGDLAAKLRRAVRRPDIRRLAGNPLLLTVMAMVHAHRGHLPEARALLYEECTDLLLWRWEERKAQVEGAAGLRRLLAEAGLQEVDLKRALWALAFRAHAGSGGQEEERATADIAETTLLRALRALHPDERWDWAAAVVAQVKERAGLLVEREAEVYAFPHRTFQEYLAACHLSVQADFTAQAVVLSEEAAFWHEVAQGKLSRAEYLERYGHRGPQEAELSLPQPAEDPDWLDKQLAEYDKAPVDVDALLAKRRAESEAAWQRLQARYPKQAPKLRKQIDQVGPAARMREAVRDVVTRFLWVERAWALRAGELTGLNDDIFLLTIDEVLDLLSGNDAATATIPARKETYARYRALPPYPMIIRGSFDPFQWAADPQRRNDIYDASAAPPISTSSTISGFAGAAGRVEGRVRVLDGPEQGDQLQPGEILVAVTTNVGWTPLFPRAAAVVTDVGAPLSHAAIVARELGIPAVVGCGSATTRLHTGDRVRVDGGQGIVEIL